MFHLVLVKTNAEYTAVEALLKNAGHEIVTDTKNNVLTFINTLENAFPDVYAAIRKGIADLKDSTLSGGDRAVKVATDVLPILPALVKDLPGIKDAVVAAVTVLFGAEVSDFKTVTTETITGLAAAATTEVIGTTASLTDDSAPTAASGTASTN